MIAKFIERFDAHRVALRQGFKEKSPDGYEDIVRRVVEAVSPSESREYGDPDSSKITRIDHGDYQGTLLFVIAACGYQPSNFWYVKVGYGSCSGCDTFAAIRELSYDSVTDEQADQYMTLALHVVQGLRAMQ